ncbi:MAG: hypothetical protein KJT01_15185, partial [Gemmatimonadetes bacterium]|nr:hypothetical protein [Gemmatimonadota bacterium]
MAFLPVALLVALLVACGEGEGPGDAAAGAAPLVTVAAEPVPAPPPRSAYAGTASCQGCHVDQVAAWSRSTHGRAGGVPGSRDNPVRVIAPFGGTALRLA